MARVCVDAGFVIGLYDRSDQFHSVAVRHFEALFGAESARHQVAVPWPILYESLGTRFANDRRRVLRLQQHWRLLLEGGQLVLLDDEPFRSDCLEHQLERPDRPLSLADRVIRAMLLDSPFSFDLFLTYNSGDFADVCRRRGILLLNEQSSPESYGF